MSGGFGSSRRIEGLSEAEIRVLGCLLEKQRTTPDAYPLSLNALRLACNQSTNRDPVVEYDEAAIRAALHRLERRGLVRLASGAGSRASKYRHLLAEVLPMDSGEQALMCVLMLRGAQTPGELKQRSERIHAFADLADVHATLVALIERGLVARLARRPGHKEERYMQLLRGEDAQAPATASAHALRSAPVASDLAGDSNGVPGETLETLSRERPPGDASVAAQALAELSERVSRLEQELADLRGAAGLSEPAQGTVRAP